jgi:hypothetical protein
VTQALVIAISPVHVDRAQGNAAAIEQISASLYSSYVIIHHMKHKNETHSLSTKKTLHFFNSATVRERGEGLHLEGEMTPQVQRLQSKDAHERCSPVYGYLIFFMKKKKKANLKKKGVGGGGGKV